MMNPTEVFHIYEENPRFLSAPEEFCRFGCLRYIYIRHAAHGKIV